MIGDLKAQPESMLAAAGTGHATATDLADWLTRELNMPFREAHHITGRLVRLADEQNCSLSDLTLEQMQSIESRISSGLYKVLTVEDSVASRQSLGGTSPVCIQKEIDRWHQRLAD
jgi:argininosuccinate lyase